MRFNKVTVLSFLAAVISHMGADVVVNAQDCALGPTDPDGTGCDSRTASFLQDNQEKLWDAVDHFFDTHHQIGQPGAFRKIRFQSLRELKPLFEGTCSYEVLINCTYVRTRKNARGRVEVQGKLVSNCNEYYKQLCLELGEVTDIRLKNTSRRRERKLRDNLKNTLKGEQICIFVD